VTEPSPRLRPHLPEDVREEILRHVPGMRVTASIVAEEAGILAGVPPAKREAERLGLSLLRFLEDGSALENGVEVACFAGSPKQVVMAEEVLLGLLAKPSGIATRARRFVAGAAGRPKIVCGAWKKMPSAMKEMIRNAVAVGGAHPRIDDGRFVYLDKNYVALLGGVAESLAAVSHLEDHRKVVQVKGRYGDIVSEARDAATSGADILFIDTGRPDDVRDVSAGLTELGLRGRVLLAFGGGVKLEEVEALAGLDLDILDVGRQIVDAPLLDMKMDVLHVDRDP